MKVPLFSPKRALLHAALSCLFVISGMSAPLMSQSLNQPSEAERTAAQRKFDLLPLRFEPNRGQSSSNAKFLAQGRGFCALFNENEAEFLFAGHAAKRGFLRVTLVKASTNAAVSGERLLPGTVNYFIGDDPEKWHTELPTFERVRYSNIYPGTDLIYYGNNGSLEFDFQLSPGAAPSNIQMRFDGTQSLRIDGKGDLVVTTNGGQIAFRKPVIYQPDQGGRRDYVAGSFRIFKKNTVRFVTAGYDRAKPLIIDPILNYSTYIGPLAYANSIAVDQNGEAYVTGVADLEFPTTPGSYQPVGVPSTSASGYWPSGGKPFVAKFNSTGTELLYSTFLSGSGIDAANGIALDANGDAYIVGTTSSTNFPITAGALQTKNGASQATGFVTELNSTGSSLLYSTYLGGSTSSSVAAVSVDGSGDAYLTGTTQDTNFPTTAGAYTTVLPTKTTSGSTSAFVAKINPTGAALVYSTYLGGNQTDTSTAITIDSAGEAYVVGSTTSTNFPVTQGAIQGSREASNVQSGFVTKLNAPGSALVYSTYLGGKDADDITSIALDSSGNAYATGSTNSPDFPVTSGAFQPNIGISYFGYPQTNAFVSELNDAGTSLVYSTFLGGGISLGPLADEGDQANGIALDSQGMVYLTGMACTGDFPVTTGAFEPQNLDGEIDGECTAFLTKMNPQPNTPLLYSTFLGGTGNGDAGDYFYGEGGNGLALDPSGNVYLAGFTLSVDFPTTAGVVETAFTGPSEEAFITAFNGSEMKSLPIPTVTLTSNTNSVLFGQPVTFTATVQPASGSNTPTGYIGFNFFQQEASDDEGLGIGFGPWTTVALNGSGVATFTTSSLEALQTQVNAFYLGDANNAPASGTMTQTVTDIPTVTTVTSSANNVPYGTPVVFTATVLDDTGKPAKGFVFFMGKYTYAEPDLDSNGQATWTNGTGGSPLPAGTDTVDVQYFPYTGYQASSGTLAETFTALARISHGQRADGFEGI
jgi:Bacterial Ig-like domain (group 3)/Beta-propeller repeat